MKRKIPLKLNTNTKIAYWLDNDGCFLYWFAERICNIAEIAVEVQEEEEKWFQKSHLFAFQSQVKTDKSKSSLSL